MTIQSIDLSVLAPTLVVAGAALVALLVHLVVSRWWAPLAVGLVGLAVAAGFAVAASGEQTMCADAIGSCSYVVAPISLALQIVVLAGTFVVLLMAAPDLQDRPLAGWRVCLSPHELGSWRGAGPCSQ